LGENNRLGSGGYYGRLWLNVQGREPQGLVPKEDFEPVRTEIINKLESLVDHQGHPLNTICYRPEDIYREVRNISSDLIIYFGNLHWRAVGSLGIRVFIPLKTIPALMRPIMPRTG